MMMLEQLPNIQNFPIIKHFVLFCIYTAFKISVVTGWNQLVKFADASIIWQGDQAEKKCLSKPFKSSVGATLVQNR